MENTEAMTGVADGPSDNHGKEVYRKMFEYLVLALLYGCLAASYLILALQLLG